jgi:hypothetical protein
LELVLSLPLLLFVMALMVDYGTAASWKVRSAMVARDAIWSSRWPRSGLATMPQPANWPAGATRGTQAAGALTVLNDAAINQPVARGPNLGQCTVVGTLLNPTRGMMQGMSGIQRPMPLLPAMPPIQFNLTHPLLTDGWQGNTAAMQTLANPASSSSNGLPSNIIYQYAQASQSLIQAYQNAVVAIWFSPSQQQIQQQFAALNQPYPRMNGFCSLNVNSVRQNDLPPLIQQIKGLPNALNQKYRQMIQNQ